MSDKPTANDAPIVNLVTNGGLMGGQRVENVEIRGNRINDPVSEYVYFWRRFVALPARPSDLVAHSAIHILGTAFTASVLNAVPFPYTLALPVIVGSYMFLVWVILGRSKNLEYDALARVAMTIFGLGLGMSDVLRF